MYHPGDFFLDLGAREFIDRAQLPHGLRTPGPPFSTEPYMSTLIEYTVATCLLIGLAAPILMAARAAGLL